MYKIIMLAGGIILQQPKTVFPNITIHDAVSFRQAKDIARRLTKTKSVDAIIAPTGVASVIEPYVTVPIVRSDPSRFDILETLRYAEHTTGLSSGRIALLLYKSQHIDLNAVQHFVKNEIHLFSYGNDKEVEKIVSHLGQKGFPVLVGGPMAMHLAERKGIQSFLLRLNPESLNRFIEITYDFLKYSQKKRAQSKLSKTILNVSGDDVLITDENGQLIESTIPLGKKVDEPKIAEELKHAYRRYLSHGFTARYHFNDIIGSSYIMQATIEKAKAFSNVDSIVLIQGETGTGKELFSQSIHNHSHRKKGPFVAINCAALPTNLLESELMGYEEGAFTSAKRGGKAGLFELAHTGTLFLDEICHIPIELQASLLRVLQERQVLRIGGKQIIPINVRIIAATNEDLSKLVHEGRFRMDLYYRLNVLNLLIPPLRQRGSDIPKLIQYYFDLFSRQYGSSPPLSKEVMRRLQAYTWPGNIREMINCIERYVIISRQLAESDIVLIGESLQAERFSPPPAIENLSGDLRISSGTFDEMEQQILKEVLRRHDGNKLQAALSLGISRSTLWKKMSPLSLAKKESAGSCKVMLERAEDETDTRQKTLDSACSPKTAKPLFTQNL